MVALVGAFRLYADIGGLVGAKLRELDAAIEKSGGNLRRLFMEMIATPSFSKRVPSKGEQP